MTEVALTPRASKLASRGQPWFFADDLATAPDGGPGLVRVCDARGHDLGAAFFSPASRLRVRLAGAWPGALDREAFFAQRLATAVARRAALRGPAAGARLVHGDADGLPGLVVDEYADCLVLQVTSAVVEANLDCVVPPLVEATGALSVLARNDVGARRHEGLAEEVRLLHGRRVEAVTIEEDGVAHEVAPFTGHKTGFYLDQRPARRRVRELAAGRRVLDAFSYQGGFALAALAGGASAALAIDQSADALARAEAAAARNRLAGLETRRANAFDALRALRAAGEQFDLVVVDPPAFAKSRREVRGAERGYRDLNRIALRSLAPGGVLVTCSCSHHVSRPGFEDLLRQAAAGLPFRTFLRERLGAGPDHPVWLALPESDYLKVIVAERE